LKKKKDINKINKKRLKILYEKTNEEDEDEEEDDNKNKKNKKNKNKKKKNQIEKTTIPFLDLNNTKKTIDGSSFNENQNN
jgi:hypothetical protein